MDDPSNNLSRLLVVVVVILGAVLLGMVLRGGETPPLSGVMIVSLVGSSMIALMISSGLPSPNAAGFRKMIVYALIWVVIAAAIVLLYKLRNPG